VTFLHGSPKVFPVQKPLSLSLSLSLPSPLKLLHTLMPVHTHTHSWLTLSLSLRRRKKEVGNVRGLYTYRHALPKVRLFPHLDPPPVSAFPAPTLLLRVILLRSLCVCSELKFFGLSMDSGSGSGEPNIRGVPTHGGSYLQYNVYGNLFEVSRKYVPPIRPVGRGAYGIVW
jgi:hypothetical protein